MPSWEAGLGGSLGGQFRIRVYSDVIATDEEGNRTLVRYSAVIDRVSGSGRIYNGYNTYGNTNLGDYGNPQRGPFRYDTSGPGRVITMASNEDRWYGHDGNGNKTIYQGANYDAGNSPYVTSGSTGGNHGLPSYYRYADPNLVQLVGSTDVSLTIRVATNRVVKNIAISLTGGGNWYYFEGDTTDRTMTIGSASDPLRPGTTYPMRISLRRRNSGYWKEWGNMDVATQNSNNFFDVGDM